MFWSDGSKTRRRLLPRMFLYATTHPIACHVELGSWRLKNRQKIEAVTRRAKGGDEPTGFLRSFSVFGWVPLSRGCPSSIPAYRGCVWVLLHLLLQAFQWLCLLAHCYKVLPGCCYMNASFSKHTAQVVLMKENRTTRSGFFEYLTCGLIGHVSTDRLCPFLAILSTVSSNLSPCFNV